MSEYLMILRDIFGGMFRPKKYFKSIYERELDMKPLFIVVAAVGLISLVSMIIIQSTAIKMLEGDLPLFVNENYEKFQLIVTSTLPEMTIQIVYSLLVTLLIAAVFLKVLVLFAKVHIEFKKCLILICYSWGPNILVSLLLAVSVILLPIERTMFAKGLFEILLGSSSQIYNIFTLIDPFYVWSIVILARYLSNYPNRDNNTNWHYWVYAIYFAPMIMNLMYLIQ